MTIKDEIALALYPEAVTAALKAQAKVLAETAKKHEGDAKADLVAQAKTCKALADRAGIASVIDAKLQIGFEG